MHPPTHLHVTVPADLVKKGKEGGKMKGRREREGLPNSGTSASRGLLGVLLRSY